MGVTICVTPPPRLPQPPVMALAPPTMRGVNMDELQYCVETNEASEKPMSRRHARKWPYLVTHVMAKHGSAVSSISTPYALRGPMVSHSEPIRMRLNTVPVTDADAALPSCVAVRSRSSRMMGASGAAIKVEQKETKKANQDRWKAVMCGNAQL